MLNRDCCRVVYRGSDITPYCGLLLYTDTVDGSSVTATAPAEDEFGWTTFDALGRKQVSPSVDTAAGAVTTVRILRTSPYRATTVLLQFRIYSRVKEQVNEMNLYYY